MAELAEVARISLAQPAETAPELLEAWLSNCPRHSGFDDAVTDGLIRVAEGREAGA